MSLFIETNSFANLVVHDLITISQDNTLQFDDSAGEVSFLLDYPANPWVASEFIDLLINEPVKITIQGTESSFDLGGGTTVGTRGGGFTTNVLSAPDVNIFYDVTNCNGLGYYWVHFNQQELVKSVTYETLFHEMIHAFGYARQALFAHGRVIELTNEYRILLPGGSQRLRSPIDERGCGPCVGVNCNGLLSSLMPNAPQQSESTGTVSSPCFVATAAYQSALAPQVMMLRKLRDEYLCKTRSGRDFYEKFEPYYREISPLLTFRMNADPELRYIVRWAAVTPIINYLRLRLEMPDESLDDVPEHWRCFIESFQETWEQWLQDIPLLETFQELLPESAAFEIGVVLSVMLGKASSREAYLARLEAKGELPLKVDTLEQSIIAKQLYALGRSADEVERIVGKVTNQTLN